MFPKKSFKKQKVYPLEKPKNAQIPASHHYASKIIAVLLGILWIIFVCIVGVFAIGGISFNQIGVPNLSSSLSSIIPASINPFAGDTQSETKPDTVNILVTGIGWLGHDGADLTDTIILVSLNFKQNTVTLFSVPRDLWVVFNRDGKRKSGGKINELYMDGVNDKLPNPMQYLEDKVSEITGQKIDAYAIVDFWWFVKLVDDLWGVLVDVPKDLTDTQYPDFNYNYTTFSIKKGPQTLNGLTALAYARSRHSTNDFDRSLRQHLVIKAVEERLQSKNLITNPFLLSQLWGDISSHIHTSLSIEQMISYALYLKSLPSSHILSFDINDTCTVLNGCEKGGFLYYPDRTLFGGASTLLPFDATSTNISVYDQILPYANLAFNHPDIFVENIPIYVINATKHAWVAEKLAEKLTRYGFNVPAKNSILSTKTKYPHSLILEDETLTASGWETIAEMQNFFTGAVQTQTGATFAKNTTGPVIELVIGDDYTLPKK